MDRPTPTRGLRHVALCVEKFSECEKFYVERLGMQVEWRPDEDNVYLTSGNDNLALHHAHYENGQPVPEFKKQSAQRLDHIGYILAKPEHVDEWYEFLKFHNVVLRSECKTHRDGARSFYCEDPDGNVVQMIYHPPIADK